MNIFKIVSNSFYRIKENWLEYLFSSFVFSIIRTILIYPTFSILFNRVLNNADIFAITDKSILSLLNNPMSMALLVVLLLLIAFTIFYELAYYFLLADYQIKGKEYSLREILRQISAKWKYFLSFQSLILIVYIVLLLPLATIGFSTELSGKIKIPNFIIDELLNTTSGLILYAVVIGIISYISLRFLYTIFLFVTETEIDIIQALKESWKMSRKRTLSNIVLVALNAFIAALITFLLLMACFLPLWITERFLPQISLYTASISLTLMYLAFIVLGTLAQPLFINSIVETMDSPYVEKSRKYKDSYIRPHTKIKIWLRKSKLVKVFLPLMIIATLIANIFLLQDTLYQPDIAIIAHRGFMEHGVENSLTALKASIDAKADMVELDIQETVDEEFVVMHDYNLKRLAGINRAVHTMTLEELENVEIYQNGFSDKIPSLKAFIQFAKDNKMALLIEVKPHGHESPDMEKNLMALIREMDFVDMCIVQSLDLNVLDKIKEVDEEINTCYVIPFLIGNLPDTVHDFIAMEDYSINDKIIAQSKEKYSGLLVWTVNDDEKIKEYLKIDIDGIITNHPDTSVNIRDDDSSKTFFDRIAELI
ncbi:MAG: hypothetical protein GXZ08_08180 [Tissierellia bacterium]|nr:hypothetical protein [Tissierellia bacterium]